MPSSLKQVSDDAGLPVMGELLVWANEQEAVPPRMLSGLRTSDVVEMYETVVESLVERIEADLRALSIDRSTCADRPDEDVATARESDLPVMRHVLGIVEARPGPAADVVSTLTVAQIEQIHDERVTLLAGCLADWIREDPRW